jgi:hypothetical protein
MKQTFSKLFHTNPVQLINGLQTANNSYAILLMALKIHEPILIYAECSPMIKRFKRKLHFVTQEDEKHGVFC